MKIHIKHQTEVKNTLKNRRVYLDKLDEDNDDDLKATFSRIFGGSSRNDINKKKSS
ncbi:hypothetical protein [Faecalibacillus intestinalis]|uniref:hypothetical protein n=1 Tax=Faecalibacillus intestinalis TaxID=1982626 RepID=UPI0013143ED6|nr:hypothetical protein [Faecalibacillus intestinalis]